MIDKKNGDLLEIYNNHSVKDITTQIICKYTWKSLGTVIRCLLTMISMIAGNQEM